MTKEVTYERSYTKKIKSIGGLCLKLVPMGLIGFPDRTIFLPGGIIFFIEFKRKGNEQQRHQKWWQRKLESLGFQYYVCYSFKEAMEATQRATESSKKRS